jgi:signal transduction histidine kinase
MAEAFARAVSAAVKIPTFHWSSQFGGILPWVIGVGIVLVTVSIYAVDILDEMVIETTAAENMQAEFLRAAGSVSRIVSNAGDVHNVAALQEAFQDIFELRPGIRHMEVFDLTPDSHQLILSSHPKDSLPSLSAHDWAEVFSGRTVATFDGNANDRAWLITAPIVIDGHVAGALRGRFSQWKYDRLIIKENQVTKVAAATAVAITSLVFLFLIRSKIHRPIGVLVHAMRHVEAGNLANEAPIVGPSDIREIARQFNCMLRRIREEVMLKERLLGEIRALNDSLQARVDAATTELRRTNLRLIEAQVQTERTEKLAALGELSAVMAHELGNPLNAIAGHVQMLAARVPARDPERHLGIIQAELNRMVEIIQHILDSTRVTISFGPIDLDVVIREVLALIEPGLPSKRITVKTDFPLDLPRVTGDPRALHGMVFNLVVNAVQAMPTGGTLEIWTAQVLDSRIEGVVVLAGTPELEAGAVRMAIRDTGQGILPEHLLRIFEPFFTTRHAAGGTGLGLAMCRRVLSAYGGRLAVLSVPKQGTTVAIDLPIWKGELLSERPSNGF